MKETKRDAAINYFMKLGAERDDYGELLILTYEKGAFLVAIFQGRCIKPACHYKFKTADDRAAFIVDKKRTEDYRIEERKQWAKRAEKQKEGIIQDAILVSSWGYEQTNIDFYQVVERKNDFVVIQEIGTTKFYDNNYNDRGDCVADPSVKVGEPFRKKISKNGGINLNSYSWCGLWDGRKMSWSSYA